ncbi:uncharacterized protein HD556DRAFT_1443437 [Suillus plorans]|uniref:Uncharacterized protein n=1 Tax=Suillus plorans TaxID=116603 RepID=A0A9P7APJ6_9AGAM|nr:uncharacterized protein HD556DRAFT_1443437 [Suillus plorans]KAG1793646.1 hypothetical protein HD556DRAFT_1443437 [Suillus plorans]
MDTRRRGLLKTFVEDVDGFMRLMEHMGTVILGLSALHLIQAKMEALELNDLDVYVTHEFDKEVVKHMKGKGYEMKWESERKTEYDGSAMKKIYKLMKNEREVDIIVTNWAGAIVPIVQYHSTAVMNYMTAHSLVCMYPEWTKNCQSLVNPQMYLNNGTNICTVMALMKYVRRGFCMSADPFKFSVHNCNMSGYCPNAVRNTIDGDTMRWNFEEVKMVGRMTVTCKDMAVVIWRLGGGECEEDSDEKNPGYIGVGA